MRIDDRQFNAEQDRRLRRVFWAIIVAMLLQVASLIAGHTDAFAAQDKVTVCHKPGTPAQMSLTIAQPALQAHLDHGDTLADCAPPAQPSPRVSVDVNAVDCRYHVTVRLPEGAGVQVNVDNHGTQDDGRFLNDNGDAVTTNPLELDFTLPKGSQHVLVVQTFNPRITFDAVHMDCRNPLEPTVVTVPGPERVVTVQGPERVRVVQHVRAGRCYAAKSKRTGKRVLVCPKAKHHKKHKARRHAKAKKPGTVILPKFTG